MAGSAAGGVFPSSNGQDRGPSSRVCRFESGRERHVSPRCSAAGQRAWSGTTRPQVRVLPARPIDSPVAQRKQERAVTTREAEGSNPSWGANEAP